MTGGGSLDVFISHAWRFHDDWTRMGEVLSRVQRPVVRNFSIPWHDPALDPNSSLGGRLIRENLESQIKPVHGVLVLASVFASKSARGWLELELEFANAHGKPIFGVPAFGRQDVPGDFAALCHELVSWEPSEIVSAIQRRASASTL